MLQLSILFFVGKYFIMSGSDVNKIEIENNQLYFNKNHLFGSILLTIVPPKNLLIPFLPIRKQSDNKSILTLCYKCAEIAPSKFFNQCKHSDIERALTSSYLISEIEFALKLGYKILKIFECHIYQQEKFIFRDFVKKLNYYKIINSGCLDKFKTLQEKTEYCTFLNKEMELKTPFDISPEKVCNNPQMKELYKMSANCLFGKIQQRHDYNRSFLIDNQSDLEEKYFAYGNQIENIVRYNDNICQMFVKADYSKLGPNRNANCYVGARITAFARQTMYEHLTFLLEKKATLYYSDTDSLFFTLKSSTHNLPISDCVGHFKEVIPSKDILSFHCLGPKNYIISFKNENKIELMTKVKGINLNSFFLQEELSVELYNDYINLFLKNSRKSKTLNQRLIKKSKSKLLASKLELITFSNDVKINRQIVLNNCNYTTVPFGYNQLPS